MAVSSRPAVELVDVGGDVGRRLSAVLVDPLLDALLLQAAEERLGDRIDPNSRLCGSCWALGDSTGRTVAKRRCRTACPGPSG